MERKLTTSEWEALSAWRDGELDPQASREIEQKLADEPAWAKALEDLQAIDEALDNWTVPAPPSDLAGRIAAACHNQPRTPRILRLAMPLSAAAAAAVVLIAVGVVLLKKPASHTVSVASQTDPSTPDRIPDAFVVEGLDVFTATPRPTGEATFRERVEAVIGRSLSDSMTSAQTPQERWAALSESQQAEARQYALAFLKLDPEQQQALIDRYAQAIAENPAAQAAWQDNSRWLAEVLDSFSPAQREALRHLTPARRAEVFLQRRHELGLDKAAP